MTAAPPAIVYRPCRVQQRPHFHQAGHEDKKPSNHNGGRGTEAEKAASVGHLPPSPCIDSRVWSPHLGGPTQGLQTTHRGADQERARESPSKVTRAASDYRILRVPVAIANKSWQFGTANEAEANQVTAPRPENVSGSRPSETPKVAERCDDS